MAGQFARLGRRSAGVVVEFERVLHGGAQVRVHLAQLAVAVHLVVVGEVDAEVLGHGQVPRDVPRPAGGQLTGRREPLGAELAQRVEHPVPLALAQHHGLVDQPDRAR